MIDQRLSGLAPGHTDCKVGGPSVKKMSLGRYSIGRRSSFARPPQPDSESDASSSYDGVDADAISSTDSSVESNQCCDSPETLPPVAGSSVATIPIPHDDLRDLLEDTPASKYSNMSEEEIDVVIF